MIHDLRCQTLLLAVAALLAAGVAGLGQTPTFKAGVNQVVVYASVYDESGELVSDLKKEDFQVFENKVLQDVTYFGLDDIPSTIGVVMDVSGSMRAKKEMVDQSTELFLDMNNPSNELFLVAFNSDVELEQDFTRDTADINDALYNLIVTGGTKLYDAIYLGVEHASEGSEPKRAILVFTDGEDKDSYYDLQEVVEKVTESDVQVFIVAFLDNDLSSEGGFFGVFKSEKEKVSKAMSEIAESTGGRAFFPDSSKELRQSFERIAHELRNQYRLAYVSNVTAAEQGDDWRTLQVRVTDARERGLRVRARKGYYAGKAGGSGD